MDFTSLTKSWVILALLPMVFSHNAQANLIANGNFEAGNVGFTSDYSYQTTSIYGPATYAITTNTSLVHPSGRLYHDHTSGRGNMMAINGAITPGKKVWGDTVDIVANTNYIFSMWLASWTSTNPALLNLSLNAGGLDIGTVSAPTTTGLWDHHTFAFNSSSLTGPIELSIVDRTLDWGGNDFAIDDLSLERVKAPAPAAALLFGLGLISLSLCRKKCAKSAG